MAARLPPAPRNNTYRIEKLNPLSFPKDVQLRCALSGKPALVALITADVTLHFSSKELAVSASNKTPLFLSAGERTIG